MPAPPLQVAYLAQEPVFKSGITVLQAVLQSDSPMARAVQDYQQALAQADGRITKVSGTPAAAAVLWLKAQRVGNRVFRATLGASSPAARELLVLLLAACLLCL
jgi:hypothetical protein